MKKWHRISEINEEVKKGTCSVCGPQTDLYRVNEKALENARRFAAARGGNPPTGWQCAERMREYQRNYKRTVSPEKKHYTAERNKALYRRGQILAALERSAIPQDRWGYVCTTVLEMMAKQRFSKSKLDEWIEAFELKTK